jgi:hypothetical protein
MLKALKSFPWLWLASAYVIFILIKFAFPLVLTSTSLGVTFWPNIPPQMSALDYYQGHWTAVCGIASQLVSGVVFLLFMQRLLPSLNFQRVFWLVFAYLLATKWEVLLNPPYGDPISGPWVEGVWLARHHFDFVQLAQQPVYNDGGPLVYLLSLYPLYLALFMKFLPGQVGLFVHHILAFLMASYVIAFVYSNASKFFNQLTALLIALIVLVLPLFQSQTEAINMELPSLFFLCLTISALSRKNYAMACLYAFLDIGAKGSGMVACALVLMSGVCDVLFDKESSKGKKLKNVGWGLLAMACTLSQIGFKYVVKDSHVTSFMGFMRGFQGLLGTYIFYLILGSCLVFIVKFLWSLRRKAPLESLNGVWKEHRSIVLFFFASINWLLLFINFSVAAGPRYKIMLCGVLVLCVVVAAYQLIPSRIVVNFVLKAIFVLSLLGSYGLYEKPFVEGQYYQYLLMDRTLEYRNDLELYKRIARYLETNYPTFTVGAPYLVAHTIGLPELGYVKNALKTVVYGNALNLEGITVFKGLETVDQSKLIWVGFKGKLAQFIDWDFLYRLKMSP